MVEERAHPNDRLEHPSVRHERTDVRFSWVLGVMIASIVLAAVIFIVLLWFFRGYENYQSAIKRSPYPLAPTPRESLPSEPRLEQLDRLRRIERPNVFVREAGKEKILDSYGSLPEQGFIRIPIGRAMTLLENKLPVRKERPADGRENGLVDAGESNSGRMFRKEPQWHGH